MMYVTVGIGSGDFKIIGAEFLQYHIKIGNIKQTDKILEVGSGIGRMAVPLTGYLKDHGSYYGFDILEAGINWCKRNITTKFPRFHFQAVDIYNQHYNPKGKIKPDGFDFPYDDELFDFVFLTSIFTHMLSMETKNYLREVFRVLKRGGRCLATFALINDEYFALASEKKTPIVFKKLPSDECYTDNPNDPEGFIGFDEQYVREMYSKVGFQLVEPILYGSWCGRERFLSYQDIVLAKKS